MKYKIKTINNIHSAGLSLFPDTTYSVSPSTSSPHAIIVRSESLHDMTFPQSLYAIARAGTGVNNIPVDRCTQEGIVVFNTLGANANAVKELVLGGMIIASRNLTHSNTWLQQFNKDTDDIDTLIEGNKKQFRGYELQDKVLGVIGLGAIGHSVANLGVSFNMKVIGYDPYLSVSNALRLSRSVTIVDSLETIMKKSDFVSTHVAYSPQTHHLINKKMLTLCKKNMILLNLSRKDIVEESAVLNALQCNTLYRYVTDFPSKNMLDNEKIIIFPHLGASTSESERNCSVLAAQAIRDFLEQGTIRGSVNFPDCTLDINNDITSRLIIGNDNVANIVAKITQVLGKNDINIENMINTHKQEIAYNIIDLDKKVSNDIINKLSSIQHVRFVRQITI